VTNKEEQELQNVFVPPIERYEEEEKGKAVGAMRFKYESETQIVIIQQHLFVFGKGPKSTPLNELPTKEVII